MNTFNIKGNETMTELHIKYIDGTHATYIAEDIAHTINGISFCTYDENSTTKNKFFIPYSSILYKNMKNE